MELTIKEKAILSHVVTDADAWVAHALATVGESAVTAKIDRWRLVYEAKKSKAGYKNRAERDTEAAEKLKPTQEQIDKAATEKLIQDKIREQAIVALKKEGKL